MTRTVTAFVSIISHVEWVWAQLDWAEIRRIVRDGLVAFVALSILAFLYTVEGVRSFYRWAQPRLASLLEHPCQTIKNGPSAIFDESIEAILTNTATPIERMIVSVGSYLILTGDNVIVEVLDLKYKLSRLNVSLAVDSVRLQWGAMSYSVIAWNGDYLSIWGQRMF